MLKDLKFNMKTREKCFDCFRPKHFCFCHLLEKFTLKSKIVILIHPMEAKKEKLGTGRITSAAIENSELIMGVDFTSDKRVNELINDPLNYPMVLYPGDDALNISDPEPDKLEHLKNKTPVIFVIDGTWPCAKKMMTLSKNINSLPRISFSTDKMSEFYIKHQPHKMALSTIESVHILIKDLAKASVEQIDGKEDSMIKAFKAMVQKQLDCASDPNIPSNRGRKSTRERTQKIREKRHRSFILK
tara:strand:- start:687 stop:1418 length:732 start_codon:yes stop_codon:yes gene_type:complete